MEYNPFPAIRINPGLSGGIEDKIYLMQAYKIRFSSGI